MKELKIESFKVYNQEGVKIAEIYEEANMNIFCDAFTVVNEFGLSPRELLEQRNELMAKLDEVANEYTKVLDHLNTMLKPQDEFMDYQTICEAKMLISGIRNNK